MDSILDKPVFTFLLTIMIIFMQISESKNASKNAAERCFCKLKGEVDDCSCKVETLDSLNNNHIYPRLQSLLTKNYFRYFKVNLHKECPYWSDDSRCALKDCHVSQCAEDDIPVGLKSGDPKENKYSRENQEITTCAEERELSALDTTISDETKETFKDWRKHDDAQVTFCELDDDNSSGIAYVDLLLNPERYTGYRGASAHRIWHSIYEENCFQPDSKYSYGDNPLANLCLEERVFYRLISGLHTSINIHLSAKYLYPGKNGYGAGTWGPNKKEFQKRFDSKTTDGTGPQRLKNLYFTYLVELRALAKVAPYLEMEDFYTGSDEDDDVKSIVMDILQVIKSFPDHFDESKMFQDPTQASRLKAEFKNHFRNISKIMDCVGCDKCRLWGKLQTQGMGTALKILFSGDSIGPESTVGANQKSQFQLRRTEIVSLFNAFGRLSDSIYSIEQFRSMMS
ncbi:hypothetical protein ScPMuIL_013873 [Solemya velum]